MPPKTQSIAAVPAELKNLTINVNIMKAFNSEGFPSILPSTSPRAVFGGIRLRIISSWAETCCTTPLFGTESMSWVTDEARKQQIISFSLRFDANLFEENNLDLLRAFQTDPFVYFFFTSVNETSIKPVDLLSIDCSSLLMKENSNISLQREVIGSNGFIVDISITNLKSIIKSISSTLLPLEPIAVTMK
jgi:hypothetical protein